MLPEAEPTSARPARQGEAPVWDDGAGELIWADAARQEVRWGRVDPGGEVRDAAVRQAGGPVGAVVPTTGPGWLLGAGGGFRSLTPDGQVAVLLDLGGDDGGLRTCSGACDRAGRFFAGATRSGDEPGHGAVHRVDLDGVVSTAHTGAAWPTGIAWSPDDALLYLADAGTGTVTAFDYDVDLGTLDRPRVLIDLDGHGGARPHGLAVDRAGHLWVPLAGAGEVRRYSAEGVVEELVPLRTPLATGCAFAGPRLDVLVVTTSTPGQSATEAARLHAGQLFATRVPDVVGRPAHPYRGPLRSLRPA